jgi:hypothetical protein
LVIAVALPWAVALPCPLTTALAVADALAEPLPELVGQVVGSKSACRSQEILLGWLQQQEQKHPGQG